MDLDGPVIARTFYQSWMAAVDERADLDAVPYALDDAVGRLRDSGVSPLRWAAFIHVGV
jgi:hypothetical protein